MKMIVPIPVTDSMLVSSVQENDYAEWSSATSYSVGTRVIRASQHKIYECLVAGVGLTAPEVTPSKWLYIAPTNKWACFDQAIGSKTTASQEIAITLTPGVRFDSLAFLDVEASNVTVDLTLPNTAGPNLLRYTDTIDSYWSKWADPGKYNTIATGLSPTYIAISPDGKNVYVANNGGGGLSIYNRDSEGALTLVGSIGAGIGPVSVAITPNGSNVYVANGLGNTLNVYRRSANGSLTEITRVSTAPNPRSIAISPDGWTLYLAVGYSLVVYRLDGSGVIGWGDTVPIGSSSLFVAISADGTSLYVARGDANLSIFKVASNGTVTLDGTVPTGTNPSFIAISADGTSLYVANYDDNYLSSYQRSANGKLTLPGSVATESGPKSIAISSDGTSVYVANHKRGTLSQYSRAGSGYLGTALSIPTGPSPAAVAISPDSKTVCVASDNNATLYIHSRSPSGTLDEGADYTIQKLADAEVGTFFRITKTRGGNSLRCGPSLLLYRFSSSTYTASVLARVSDATSRAYPIYINTDQLATVSEPQVLGVWQTLRATASTASLNGNVTAFLMVYGPIGSFVDVAAPWVENGDTALRGNDAVPYSKNISLVSPKEPIVDYLSYWLAEFVTVDTVMLTDLASFWSGAVLKIKIQNDSGSGVSVGAVVLGKSYALGDEQYGMSNGITDYSESITDKFGVTTITERSYAKRMTTSIIVSRANYDFVCSMLSLYRAKPVIWTAGSLAANTIYGYLKDWSGQINYLNYTVINLEIKGLV